MIYDSAQVVFLIPWASVLLVHAPSVLIFVDVGRWGGVERVNRISNLLEKGVWIMRNTWLTEPWNHSFLLTPQIIPQNKVPIWSEGYRTIWIQLCVFNVNPCLIGVPFKNHSMQNKSVYQSHLQISHKCK